MPRCIIHVDLDAFYAQVEQLRTATDPTTPLAVQQWSAVIAVNYPARKHGVTRHLTVSECMQRCPELRLVHVATMSIDRCEEDGDLEALNSGGCGGDVSRVIQSYGALNGIHSVNNRRCKASLEPYRRASKAIFASIRSFFASFDKDRVGEAVIIIEKASVDEAFIEVPSWVLEEYADTVEPIGVPIAILQGTVEGAVDDENICDNDDNQNVCIIRGTAVAEALRRHVKQELGFTMSAGIAKNKTLAKLASAKNKPDNQTFVLEEHIDPLMKATPFSKIRFLGGKLGNMLRRTAGELNSEDDHEFNEDGEVQYWAWNKPSEVDSTAFELQQLTVEELTVKTGDRQSATWIYNVIRGRDDSPVIDRSLVKSFMSAKQHRPPCREQKILLQWIRLFAVELYMRVVCEFEETRRWPQTICLHYRRPNQNTKSKTTPFTLRHLHFSPYLLYTFIYKHLILKCDPLCPVNMIGVSIGKFVTMSAAAGSLMDSFIRQSATTPTDTASEPLFKPTTTPTTVLSHFRRPTDQGNDTAWKCNRCSKWFHQHEQEKIQEHQDHHMAMDLARMS